MSIQSIIKKHGISKGCMVLGAKAGHRFVLGKKATELRELPMDIVENRIVFESKPNFSDNARALYDYLCEEGYNTKYEIIWLVNDDPKKYEKYKKENVKFVRAKGKYSARRTLDALKAIYTAKYVIFTHSLHEKHSINREKQLYINLWHGCGYKAAKGGSESITFDYCLVPGDVFVETKTEFFQCEEEKFLPIGYPRYDLFQKENANAAKFLKELFPEEKEEFQSLLWMPTYRKSYNTKLNEDTLTSKYDLPLIYTKQDFTSLDQCLGEHGVKLVIKQHYLQADYDFDVKEFKNITFLTNEQLAEEDVQLYELLSKVDGVITDYSSVAIDYLLLNRPLAFTLDDFKTYEESRGFVFEDPLEYMPGPHMYELKDMLSFIHDVSLGNDEYEEQRQQVLYKTHNVTKDYCKRVVDFFEL